jgi:hypothetical protein
MNEVPPHKTVPRMSSDRSTSSRSVYGDGLRDAGGKSGRGGGGAGAKAGAGSGAVAVIGGGDGAGDAGCGSVSADASDDKSTNTKAWVMPFPGL